MNDLDNETRNAPGQQNEETGNPFATGELLSVYARANRMAISRNQTVGEKREYYVTLEQLEAILQRL